MKKLILSIALLGSLTTAINAQTTPPAGKTKGQKMKNATPEERAKAGANHAEKKLSLTADQKTKWEAAALERIKANEPYREKMKGSTTPEERKTLHAQMKANIDKFDATVSGFLTGDQKAKFDQMKAEKRDHAKKHAKGNDPVHQLESDD